jgi:hypothetical protein
MVLCGVAGVVGLLSLCDSVAQCSFYWVVLVLFVGAQPGFLRAATAADGDVVRDRLLGWSSLMANATGRMMGLRAKALAAVGRDHLHIFKQPLPPKPDPAAGSAILLYTPFGAIRHARFHPLRVHHPSFTHWMLGCDWMCIHLSRISGEHGWRMDGATQTNIQVASVIRHLLIRNLEAGSQIS